MSAPNPKAIEAVARAIYHASSRNRPFDLLSALKRETLLREARAAIDAYEREAWRPANEAPRDGTDVLLCWEEDPGTMIVASWNDDAPDQELGKFAWATLDGPSYPEGAFSHFRPLPSPPKAE